MNMRGKLLEKVYELTDDNIDAAGVVEEFVNEIKDKFEEIYDLINEITIDNLDYINDAKETAEEMMKELS